MLAILFCLGHALFTHQGVSCNLCFTFSFFSLLLFSSLFRFVECSDCGRKFHEICVYYCYLIWPGGWVKLKVFITSIICILECYKILLSIKTVFVILMHFKLPFWYLCVTKVILYWDQGFQYNLLMLKPLQFSSSMKFHPFLFESIVIPGNNFF